MLNNRNNKSCHCEDEWSEDEAIHCGAPGVQNVDCHTPPSAPFAMTCNDNNPCHSERSEESSLPVRGSMTFKNKDDSDYCTTPAMTCKAFTFAELMVSLVIIAVITALLYPTISEISPNNNKQLFKSAYKTIELAVQDMITAGWNVNKELGTVPDCIDEAPADGACDNQGAIDAKNAANKNTAMNKLCEQFQNRLNSVSFKNSAGSTTNGCETTAGSLQLLQTSNGMRWYIADYSADKDFTVYVDVNASNNNITSPAAADEPLCDGEPADTQSPKTPWTNGCFRACNSTVRDTFRIKIKNDGRIVVDDFTGMSHLREESE